MKLANSIKNVSGDTDCQEIIARYLAKKNPSRLASLIVWGSKVSGFFCQAHEHGQLYGSEFAINLDNETLKPV